MDLNFIIIDNFLDDPDRLRRDALSLDFDRIRESVPGVRSSSALVGDHQTEVETKLKTIFGGEIVWDCKLNLPVNLFFGIPLSQPGCQMKTFQQWWY